MMSCRLNILRLASASRSVNLLDSSKNRILNSHGLRRLQSSNSGSAKGGGLRTVLVATAVGGTIGASYSYYKSQNLKKAILNSEEDGLPVIWKELPHHRISREVVNSDKSLEIYLFQYPTCPFCCKVRAFLDYNGLSYNVIEVNPIRKTELKWSDYRKVPILLVKVDEGYLQLNDSSVIVSVLSTYLNDTSTKLTDVVKFYPNIAFMDDDGTIKKEVLNRYHVMYHGQQSESASKRIVDERNSRKWADNVLVHMLSPNVYRTREEAIESFEWFSKVGEWDKNFSSWEVTSIVYLGSTVMYWLGKRLKKKYNLKSDVRESLYDSCNQWLKLLNAKGTTFHGGSRPDLADLAVFGVLSSIEGCSAFGDLRKKTKLSGWYDAMKSSVALHDGQLAR